ncbi:hypothetical protein [Glutamicibacter protophormiae]|uniref:hypothetical protein n=1 Tax=Glutamicibacter protophormiae TaxID=37930 RepID=UPI00332BEAE2
MYCTPDCEATQGGSRSFGWMACTGTAALTLGIAFAMLFVDGGTPASGTAYAAADRSQAQALGQLLANSASVLLVFGGMAMILGAWILGRRSPRES